MYKYILALFLATAAQAQDSVPFFTTQICKPALLMFEDIDQFGETPLFTGAGVTFTLDSQPVVGGMMLFVNQDTGTWSLVSFYDDGMSCLVTVGREFEPYAN
jgi:hypothetical protein